MAAGTVRSEYGAAQDVRVYHLDSGDFNRLPVMTLGQKIQNGVTAVRESVHSLLRNGDIDPMFSNLYPNPHIKPSCEGAERPPTISTGRR
jgi:hypothetical protein